jgi:molybdenum cofactor biosynthesis protein B
MSDHPSREQEHASDEHGHGHEEEHSHNHEHGHHHHDLEHLGVGVVTVSSSRTMDDDQAGDAIVAAVENAGHEVSVRELLPDELDSIQGIVNRLVDRKDIDVVVTSGGTGVTPDDVTIEAVQPLFEKRLPGFGELFRRLSYDDIGTKVVGTRATAGISKGVPVFCLPGSEAAVRLGVDEIILEEAPHLAGLARRDEDEDDEE